MTRLSSEILLVGVHMLAFWETDQQIGEEKKVYSMPGGCTVLVALFILGKLYVANAGDSRAVLTRSSRAYPMSYDFTPVTERTRLQTLGRLAPQLLGSEYTWLEYVRRPTRRDIGSRMLYREGKRSRLLATIGVTRGFGDHDLRAQAQTGAVLIKPFLSPQPEVRVLDVENETVTAEDVLVLGTDGLWDVVSNDEVAAIVQRGLQAWDNESKAGKYRYISLAQDLVMAARGKMKERNWRRSSGGLATIDDISVFVIPVLPYKQEVLAAKSKEQEEEEEGREAMEVEEERVKGQVMEVEEEKIGTDAGEVCDTKEDEEALVNGLAKEEEAPIRDEEAPCDQARSPLDSSKQASLWSIYI